MGQRVELYRAQVKLSIATGEIVRCGICGDRIWVYSRQVAKAMGVGRRSWQRESHWGKGGLTVDHIIPKSKGGTDDPANLQPAHRRCNNEKGDSIKMI